MQSAKHKREPANDPWSFVYPLTIEEAAAMTALRSAVADMKGKLEGVTARAPFNGIMERVEAPEGVSFEEDAVGGISGWWARPADAPIRRIRRPHLFMEIWPPCPRSACTSETMKCCSTIRAGMWSEPSRRASTRRWTCGWAWPMGSPTPSEECTPPIRLLTPSVHF
jgi:hypothetical protein